MKVMEKSDSRSLYEMKLTTGMAFIYGPEGKKAHEDALQSDKDKSYRLVINLVGKVCQGKTSLRRLLVGESFNEREESTVGIEHELVETLGTAPSASNSWTKVDLHKANVDECDLIVGKHVRKRLEKSRRGKKHRAEIKSFLKAIILSYFMLILYFTLAEMSSISHLPWFSVFLIVSFGFSGIVLFDSIRDGFGMAVGTLCLVLYCDNLLSYKAYDQFANVKMKTCLTWSLINALVGYAWIHAIMAFSMGLSMAMGFCFVMCMMQPRWSRDNLDHSPLMEPHLHVFTLSILVGIWSLRHSRLVTIIVSLIAVVSHFVPQPFVFSIISGLGCGFSHVLFIKLGFDIYVKVFNPVLKTVASERRERRLISYVFGIIPGLFIVWILKWEYPPEIFLHVLFGVAVIAFVEFCHHLLEGKVDAAPKASINNASKVLNVTSEASLKFVIRDFAGHPLYHSIHHIYMVGHCVYIIVFNMVEAKRNFKVSYAEIIYWLQAIFVHDRFPNVRAFIVGTHRDDRSLSKEDIELLTDKIMTNLPRQFHNMVVWNKLTDRPVFYVENSLRNEKDPDHLNLRKHIFSLSKDAIKPEYPIKYLYFYRVINKCREAGKLIESIDDIADMCALEECSVTGPGELEDLLNYFQECGEVIYNSHDNNQNQLVVLDPKALVNIMISLVRPPPRSERAAEFMLAWQTVAELGISTERLLYHIVGKSSLVSKEVSVPVVIQLLESMDLVCKLDLGSDGRNATGDICYLLIPLLRDTLPFPQNYWPDMQTDTVVYVDFGPVIPKFVYTRLVCQCTSESHIDIGTDGSYHLNVSTSKALFTYRNPPGSRSQNSQLKIELMDLSVTASPGQQLLKIVIRGRDQDCCMRLTRRLCQRVSNIVERDFKKCRYKIGVQCPFNAPHDYCQYEERHIFSLYESIKPEGPGVAQNAVSLPNHREMWCRGRAFAFQNGQIRVTHDEGRPPLVERRRSVLWDINVLDLPPRLFSDICDDLNLPNSLGRNWRELAGELGRSMRDVDLLVFRSPRDPCDALLHDWAASCENATVQCLVDKLTHMERHDVVRRIRDYIEGNE